MAKRWLLLGAGLVVADVAVARLIGHALDREARLRGTLLGIARLSSGLGAREGFRGYHGPSSWEWP
jgi:hypothetical protein